MHHIDEDYELRGLDNWITNVPDEVEREKQIYDDMDPELLCTECGDIKEFFMKGEYCCYCDVFLRDLERNKQRAKELERRKYD